MWRWGWVAEIMRVAREVWMKWLNRGVCALLLGSVAVAGVYGCKKDPAEKRPSGPVVEQAATEIDRAVIKIVAEQMGVDPSEIKRSTRLVDDLKADELDQVELVMELEDTFKLSIDDADAEKFLTVGNIIDYVRSRVRP